MKKFFILLMLIGFTTVSAQINISPKNPRGLISLLTSHQEFAYSKTIPLLNNIPFSSSMFGSAFYWQGSLYTSYSENGRFRSAHSFDVLGNLRESKASFSLKKTGLLSYWRVQFSPQRGRPLFTYTIH